ncbi:MAG TPA: 5'-3' exonuclease H3TH domain-containing protein, partial [Chitinophagaceae bacterium]
MPKKVFLLDAMALIFRAYYALIRNPRLTSKGKNTNAQFVFTNTLVELINNQKPSHMAVCFDTAAPTERHTDFEEYKANRQEAPEDILTAIPDIKKIITGFNIPIIEVDGYEADDVIGTLCKQAEKAGYEVFMVTPDKDYGQLVSEHIKIYKPGYQGGDVEIMGPKEVCEKWCIESVDQVIDMLGLMGDAVDNIPGIAGVGQKTACKLLTEYKTLENVLENADKIKGALGEKVRAGKENALLSKKLATIITNTPVQFHEEDFRLKDWNRDGLWQMFTELEFKSIGKRILGDDFGGPGPAGPGVQADLFGNAVPTKPRTEKAVEAIEEVIEEISEAVQTVDKNIHNCPHDYQVVQGDQELAALVKTLMGYAEICFDTETTNIDANDAELVGFSFSVKPCEGWFVPCPPDQEQTKAVLAHFSELFNDGSKLWVGQNLKYDMLVLKWYGYELEGSIFDTMLAHYVIEPDGKRSMDMMSAKYLGY